jgi:hypothetical protein
MVFPEFDHGNSHRIEVFPSITGVRVVRDASAVNVTGRTLLIRPHGDCRMP